MLFSFSLFETLLKVDSLGGGGNLFLIFQLSTYIFLFSLFETWLVVVVVVGTCFVLFSLLTTWFLELLWGFFLCKPGFHSVYYIGTMPRFVERKPVFWNNYLYLMEKKKSQKYRRKKFKTLFFVCLQLGW